MAELDTSTQTEPTLAQVLALAWAKRLSEPSSDSFGVQHYTRWSDYPDWEDRLDWDGDEGPIRFATVEDAIAWLDAEEAIRFTRAHADWRKRKAKHDQVQDLYERRRQCLVDHGLWMQDGETVQPLIAQAGPGREPVQGWQDSHRVVPDAQMDEPTIEEAP